MAQVDFFLKLEGVDGESEDAKHKGEMQLESWSWGETNRGTMDYGGGGGAGKVSMQDFTFVKKIDKGSPKLVEKCASGEHIQKATLIARKAGKEQQEYLKIEFTDCLVSSYQTGGSDVVPLDTISLNFAKIVLEYKEQKKDGTLGGGIKGGWDVKQNQSAA